MNVLLLDPEDSPVEGPWAGFRWDLIVDLAWAGRYAYERWSQRLGCPVINLNDFGKEIDDLLLLKQILNRGSGYLIDSEGIDWWEIGSPSVGPELFRLILICRLSEYLEPTARILASRPGKYARALGLLRGLELRCLASGKRKELWGRLQHYAGVLSRFSPAQLLEITLDKWDSSYQLRRRFGSASTLASDEASVLLPSGYVNVSRAVAGYARMLPDQRFLLVTTRRSGTLAEMPSNVRTVSLAAYAPTAASSEQESLALIESWKTLSERIIPNIKELALADKLGVFDEYPNRLARGLVIRDAWRRVFDSENISMVLCGDENNPDTRIPVILGRGRGLRLVSCHHGALDATMLTRELSADLYLTKGEMEADYLVETCGLAAERVVIGAPDCQAKSSVTENETRSNEAHGSSIVFFSEPYELYPGRADEIYRELLPPLCEVARRAGCNVIVKLHPFESRRERTRLVNSLLSPEDRALAKIVDSGLSLDLLAGAWFGVTVQSSVAVECTLQGVPCFLCGWLEPIGGAYVQQFAKFGAGYVLNSPDDIKRIAELIHSYRIGPEVRRRLLQPIEAVQLGALLSESASRELGAEAGLVGAG